MRVLRLRLRRKIELNSNSEIVAFTAQDGFGVTKLLAFAFVDHNHKTTTTMFMEMFRTYSGLQVHEASSHLEQLLTYYDFAH